MTNIQLYALLQTLNNLEELSGIEVNHDDETLSEVIDFINNKRSEEMFSAAFCIVVADIFDEYLLFDEAQSLLEEALARNETDGSLDPDEYETAVKDLNNLRNPGYRRFHRLLNSYDTDLERLIQELKVVLEEGFESADVWGMLGASYADLHVYGNASDALRKCLAIDKETEELSPERRELALQYLREH